jgi:hypothetical protein
LEALLREATSAIDRMTGWYFEPRATTVRMDGRGTPTVEPPVPPILLESLLVDGRESSLSLGDVIVVGSPVPPGFDGPRLTLANGVFPKGRGNVVATGLWGFTEPDEESPLGRTPLGIRRAAMLLVLRTLPPLADGAAFEARSQWRVVEERTRDQSVKFGPVSSSGTGGPSMADPEVEALLADYLRPRRLGAA